MRGPESARKRASVRRVERADVYHCAPVPPQIFLLRHDDSGRATRFSGCPSGGAAISLPISGQVNVQSNYWSGTEFNSSNAWNFNFNNGNQNNDDKSNNNYGWAVRPGE